MKILLIVVGICCLVSLIFSAMMLYILRDFAKRVLPSIECFLIVEGFPWWKNVKHKEHNR